MGNVQYRVILHIGAGADSDRVHIAANNCAGPDRGIIAEMYIANYRGGGVHIDSLAKLGGDAAV